MLRSCAAIVACAAALPAAALVAEPLVARPLRPLPGEAPAFMLQASGVQVYQCLPLGSDPNVFAWTATAPQATLFDGSRSVARWTGTNQWEAIDDRSSISGVVRSMQAAGANDLPWALLRAIPVGDSGLFAGVTSVQRVNTRGGAAPTGGCDASRAGEEARVDFSADLYFYKRSGAA